MNPDHHNPEPGRAAPTTADRNHETRLLTDALAHDLRVPIRAIRGFASALGEDLDKDDPKAARAHLRRIVGAAERLDLMTESLVRLAKLGERTPVIVHENVSATCDDILTGLAESAPGRRVLIDVQRGLEIMTDRGILRLVLESLLHNAWKFTADTPDARIRVTGEKLPRAALRVRISDNGAGFDLTLAEPHLFTPFRRFHAGDTFPGLGLGLALSRRGVAKLDGDIRCESSPGAGCTITLTLPMIHPPHRTAEPV